MKSNGDIPHPREKIVLCHKYLEELCRTWERENRRICLTTGVFDLLHDGHLYYLFEARKTADCLIVGIDSNSLVKKAKGKDRPVNDQSVRSLLIAGFGFVDLVTIHDNSCDLVKVVRPHVFVASTTTGVDPHNSDERKDCHWVKQNGGEIVVFGPLSKNSTTKIIRVMNGKT